MKRERRRLDELQAGDLFRDGMGDVWVKDRPHGAHRGVWYARRVKDGEWDCFAGHVAFRVVHDKST